MEIHWSRTQTYTTWQTRSLYPALKRLMDLVLSLVALLFSLPPMALIAALVRLDSPGPAFFVQTRVGKGGRPFRIFKFRTMHHKLDSRQHAEFMRAFVRGEVGDTERVRTVYKPFSDAQVTRLGKFLRKTSLDELPQLVNVLRGEMSLVGPRPNVPWEVEEYQDWHKERLNALPGITGLAQVNGRSGLNWHSIVQWDIEYVRNQSLWLDLRILWKTVAAVVDGRGVQ